MRSRATVLVTFFLGIALSPALTPRARADVLPTAADDLPTYLHDRGTGVSTSIFGTYVRKGELLFYPFYEYTRNRDQEYKPSELGFAGEHDQRALNTEREDLVFFSYGISENVALEVESALH